jgi:hypothetical protein
VQEQADQQRLAGLLPMSLQSLAIGVHQQHGQVLHIAYLVLAALADFI